MLTEPVTFEEAVSYISGKVDKPTALKSKQIAALWSRQAKARSFFSARVASADILTEFHRRCAQVVNGEMTEEQGRELLRRWMNGDGAGLLADLGFLPPDTAPDAISQLGSMRRVNLILYQNTKMSQEVGQYREWAENADAFPYGVWHLGVSEEHRQAHAARDGHCYPFKHEVWRNDPPGNLFNCHCWREEITAAEAARRGLAPQPLDPVDSTGLGFDPAAGIPADPPPVKAATLPELKSALADDVEEFTRENAAAQDAFAAARAEIKAATVKEDQATIAAWKAEAEAAKAAAETRGMSGAAAFGEGLKPTGRTVGGSTGAVAMRDADGIEWIVKSYHGNETQARNEWIANQFYHQAGIAVPETRLAVLDGKVSIASRFSPGMAPVGLDMLETAGKVKAVSSGFVTDAWLANWDVAGMGGDNILKGKGKAAYLRVDQGGALLFRAQGTPKGAAFGPEVGELFSLRDPHKNPASAKLFSSLTDADLARQIRSLKVRIKPPDIERLVAESGMEGPQADALKKTLNARLDYLKKWERLQARKGQTSAAPAAGVPVYTDINQLHRAVAPAWKTLSQEEKNAVMAYTGSGYRRFNELCKKRTVTAEIKALDSALEKLPRFQGMVGRGHCQVDDLPGGWGAIEKWASGEWAYFDNAAYSSTSPHPDSSWSKPIKVFFRLSGKHPGGYVDPVSSNAGEREYLVGRGFKGRVTGIGWNSSKTSAFLVVDEVLDHEQLPKKQNPPQVLNYNSFISEWKKLF